ncbi:MULTISPECIES: VanZ family protein [unclassified Agromyces]|uniref:VanZ family protein n=1 Tax=unclassified Agromyces TaxID=2639701 RepID=UPI0030152F1D
MRPLRPAPVLLVAYVGLVLWATLGPVPWAGHGYQAPDGVLDWRIWLDADTWTMGTRTEFVLNVLMFVPLGALLALTLRRAPLLVVTGVAVALGVVIELAQISMVDRISDPRDVVANAGGAFVGVLIARGIAAIAGLSSQTPAPARARAQRTS